MDILLDILDRVLEEHPKSEFLISIRGFYLTHGGLSKKQLEGLFAKAKKINGIPAGKLATLEAIIKKKATKYKSEKPLPVQEVKDAETGDTIARILEKFPQHKQVLFLKLKYDNKDPISPAEKEDLKRFAKMLLKK